MATDPKELPIETKRRSIAMTFESTFPTAKKHNDPKVLEKVRCLAMTIAYHSLKGQKVDKERLETAKFVLSKLSTFESPKNVQVNFITWKDVAKAVDKAGLPVPIDVDYKNID